MPVRGTKPKEAIRHRVKPVHDWTEVEDIPFDGPELPKVPGEVWPVQTKRWWKVVSSMPHCVLWADSDWQFAIDSASVAAAFHRGDLRQGDSLLKREKIMGTTIDFRRDLRIRYVDPAIEAPKGVTAIDKYRKMVE